MLTLEDFQSAKKRVDEVILETRLIHSEAFSEECGNDVYIKPENLQKTGMGFDRVVVLWGGAGLFWVSRIRGGTGGFLQARFI